MKFSNSNLKIYSPISLFAPDFLDYISGEMISFKLRDYLKRNPELMNYYNTRPNEDNRNLYTFTEKAIEILVSYKLFEMQKLKRLGIETCQGFSLTYNNSFEEEKEWERRQEINKEAFETARHDFIIDLDGIRHEDEF